MITFKSRCKEKDNPEATLIGLENGGSHHSCVGETSTEITLVRGITSTFKYWWRWLTVCRLIKEAFKARMMVGMAVNSRYSRCSVETRDWLYPPLFLNSLFFKDSLSLSLGFGISIRIVGQWAPGIGLHPQCRSYTAITQLSSGHETHSKFHKLNLVILSWRHLFSLEVQGSGQLLWACILPLCLKPIPQWTLSQKPVQVKPASHTSTC